MENKIKILITNDDGIAAPGIKTLAEYAKKFGSVTVVAPKVEQSGKSHAIEFTKPFEIKKVELIEGVTAYSLDSTPADCVRFGFMGLGERFDIVLSGINRGVNLGADIVYSGTVGAVFEAGRLGAIGIAVSTYPDTLSEAVAELDRVADFLIRNKLTEHNSLYNINIPNNPRGIRITKQGSPYFSDEFVHLEGDLYMQKGGMIPDISPCDMERDTVALEEGYISITPLAQSRTNFDAFEKLKTLSIDSL